MQMQITRQMRVLWESWNHKVHQLKYKGNHAKRTKEIMQNNKQKRPSNASGHSTQDSASSVPVKEMAKT